MPDKLLRIHLYPVDDDHNNLDPIDGFILVTKDLKKRIKKATGLAADEWLGIDKLKLLYDFNAYDIGEGLNGLALDAWLDMAAEMRVETKYPVNNLIPSEGTNVLVLKNGMFAFEFYEQCAGMYESELLLLSQL